MYAAEHVGANWHEDMVLLLETMGSANVNRAMHSLSRDMEPHTTGLAIRPGM